MIRKSKILYAVALFIVIAAFTSEAFSSDYNPVFKPKLSPDGVVGNIHFELAGEYNSVSKIDSFPVIDAQHYTIGLGWVLSDRFSINSHMTMISEDTTRYIFDGALKIFLSDPFKTENINADGKIGVPILKILGQIHYSGINEKNSSTAFGGEIIYPMSHKISLMAGYKNYEELPLDAADEYFGNIKIYTSAYSPKMLFYNPDGPIGAPVILFGGGGSKNGNFGQARLIFPMNPSLTYFINFAYLSLDAPFDKILSAQIGLKYYLGL